MNPVQKSFKRAVRDFDRGKTFLVGVSGGRDSGALLHLLLAEGFENLVICHLNHQVRKSAEGDQRFVKKLAELLKMRLITDNLPAKTKYSEASLRRSRLSFFAKTAEGIQAEGIFLGHHADDLAETFLWNLLRGSGMTGLSGIDADRVMKTDSGSIRIIRPMLEIWRSDIDDYVKEKGITFVDDETNCSQKFTRNQLRLDILPMLEKTLGRNVRQNLHRVASILKEENLTMDSLVPELPESGCLEVDSLRALPSAIQRRTILRWLQHQEIDDVGFQEVELVRSLLNVGSGPPRVNLPGDRLARRRAGKITICRQGS